MWLRAFYLQACYVGGPGCASAAFASVQGRPKVIGTNVSFAIAPETNAHGNFFDASPNKTLHSERFERAD